MQRMLSSPGQRRQRCFALTDIHRHLPMADVDALRQSGRAAGILQGRKIVGRRPRLGQTPLRLVLPRIKRAATLADPHCVRDAERRSERFDSARNLGVVDNDNRIGVFKNVAELAFGIGRVDRHRLRARGMSAEHRNRHIERVRAHQRNAAAARPVPGQLLGKTGDAAQVLRIAETARPADQRRLIGKARRGIGQHMHDGREYPRQILDRIRCHPATLARPTAATRLVRRASALVVGKRPRSCGRAIRMSANKARWRGGHTAPPLRWKFNA